MALAPGSRLVGVRLRPGVAGALLEQLEAGKDPRALLLRAIQLRGAELDPHMTAEVTQLAGVSPVRFLKDRAPTAA